MLQSQHTPHRYQQQHEVVKKNRLKKKINKAAIYIRKENLFTQHLMVLSMGVMRTTAKKILRYPPNRTNAAWHAPNTSHNYVVPPALRANAQCCWAQGGNLKIRMHSLYHRF